jgi:hypothetical protein
MHWEAFVALLDDPLVQAMLPIPAKLGASTFFLCDPDDTLALHLQCLSRLTSPIRRIVRPAWSLNPKDVSTSNIQPSVLTQIRQTDQAVVDKIARMANYSPFTTILTGPEEAVVPSQIKTLTTGIHKVPLADLLMLPLENIGAAVLRNYARKEPLGFRTKRLTGS